MERDNREPLKELARALIGQVEKLLEAPGRTDIELVNPPVFIQSKGGFDAAGDDSYMEFFVELNLLWRRAIALQKGADDANTNTVAQLKVVKKSLSEFH
jgi:hypothetical protein